MLGGGDERRVVRDSEGVAEIAHAGHGVRSVQCPDTGAVSVRVDGLLELKRRHHLGVDREGQRDARKLVSGNQHNARMPAEKSLI